LATGNFDWGKSDRWKKGGEKGSEKKTGQKGSSASCAGKGSGDIKGEERVLGADRKSSVKEKS